MPSLSFEMYFRMIRLLSDIYILFIGCSGLIYSRVLYEIPAAVKNIKRFLKKLVILLKKLLFFF